MSATLQFIGCGDAFGSGGRYQTCFHVQSDKAQFLIDCGASSPVALKHFGVDAAALDFIVITHFHGDHFGGLPFLAVEERIFRRRKKPLVVVGPAGIEGRVAQAAEVLFPGSTARGGLGLQFFEFEQGPVRLGAAMVEAFPVVHSEGTRPHAVRISSGGKVISYSGDTEWTENLLPVAADADLFVCEAYFREKKVPKHLDYGTLAANRARFGCRRLVLTHMHDDMLQHLSEVSEECAHDGLQIAIP